MSPFRFNGYVIVSAEGMLSDRHGVMPETLKFPGDLAFFTAGLDRADLIVHGRNSFEDQPDSPKRTRIILSRTVASVAPDPDNPKATLWNPAGAPFEEACDMTGVHAGTIAVIGGPVVFEMFFDRFDVFWLSQAPHVHLPDGKPCFPGCTRSIAAGDPDRARHACGRNRNSRCRARRQRHGMAPQRLSQPDQTPV